MRPRLGAGGVLLSTLVVSLMVAIPAAVLWPVYRDQSYLLAAGGAIVAGALVALLGARFRWPSFVVAIVAAVLFVGIGVPLAIPSRADQGVIPTPEGLTELVAAVATSWKQLLTITLPVGDYQALLVPAFVTFYVTEVVALSIALRARLPELAVIPPVVALVVAILFGPVDAESPLPLGLGLLAVALSHLVWWRRRRRRAAIRALAQATPDAAGRPLETVGDSALGARAVLAVLLSLALAGGAALGAVAVAPVTAQRDVLRTAVEQPFDPRDYPSPLAGFRRYFLPDRADQVLFTIDGLPDGALVRLATLDSYDGVVAAVGSAAVDAASGTFVRIPRSVDRSELAGEPVTVDVEIGAYAGVWLPSVGAFESVAFRGDSAARRSDAFYFNTVVDTGAVLGGLSEGDAYRITAVLPDQPTEAALEAATPGSAVVARVDGIPEEVGLYLDEQVASAATPGARLLAMLAALRRDGYISHGVSADEPASRSGHGADRLAELVTAPQMIGDAEQYAVVAALMARQLGFPARVVMGFAPQDGVVRGTDVTAWIEVDTAEDGWVAVNPVPEERPIPEERPDDANQVARPPSIVPPPPDRVDAATDPVTPESTQEDPDEQDAVLAAILAVARGVAIGLAVLIVLVAPFLLIVIAKARRRRLRRLAASPVDRIRGGWDEWVDTILDHGFEAPPAATRAEVAVVVGGLPSRVLAAATDRAVFAPEQVDPADADRVWAAVGDLRTTLAAGTRRRNRLRALVSLRSLGASSIRSVLRREGKTR